MRNNTTDLGKELCLLNQGDRMIKEFKLGMGIEGACIIK